MSQWYVYANGEKYKDLVLNDAEKELISKKDKKGIIKFKKVPEKTTPKERAEFGGVLAGMFPNVTEDVMNENTDWTKFSNEGSIFASGIQDLSTLGPRFYTTLLNGKGWNSENLGTRIGESEGISGIAEDMSRDPLTYAGAVAGRLIGPAVESAGAAGKTLLQGAANKARSLFGKAPMSQSTVENVGKAGRVAGSVAGTAGINAGTEYVDSAVRDSEAHPMVAALIGAGFEGAAQTFAALCRKFGNNLVESVTKASIVGNTKDGRPIGPKEVAETLNDPVKRRTVEKSLEILSSGKNMIPGADNVRSWDEAVINSKSNAMDVLKDDPMLQVAYRGDGSDVAGADITRIENILGNKDVELHKSKAPARVSGDVNQPSETFATDVSDVRFDPERKYQKTNNEVHLDNFGKMLDNQTAVLNGLEYDLGKVDPEMVKQLSMGIRGGRVDFDTFCNFMNKDKAQPMSEGTLEKMFKRIKAFDMSDEEIVKAANKGRKKPMTEDEAEFIETLRGELEKDAEVYRGFDAQSSAGLQNQFLGNKDPFQDKIKYYVSAFLKNHKGERMTQSFNEEVNKLLGTYRVEANEKAAQIREALKNYRGSIEKALDYSKQPGFYVKKGYHNALDRFADTINGHIKQLSHTSGVSGSNQEYIRNPGQVTGYAYDYLKKLEDMVRNQQAVDADMITSLYGKAANANDEVVMKAIITLLNDLGVDPKAVKEFEKIGGDYARLNKVRTRALGGKSLEVKGGVLRNVVPRKGINLMNEAGYAAQKHNINLMNLGENGHKTSAPGNFARYGVYFLGRPVADDIADVVGK